MNSSKNRPVTMREMAKFRHQNQRHANFAKDDNPNYLGYGAAAGGGAALGLGYANREGLKRRAGTAYNYAQSRAGQIANQTDRARDQAVRTGRNISRGVQQDFGSIGKNYREGTKVNQLNANKQGGLKRGTRLGAGLNSGRKFLLGTNTGRAGLAAGALGLGYAGYRGLRGND